MKKRALKAGDELFIVTDGKGMFSATVKDIEYDLDDENERVIIKVELLERIDAKRNTKV